MDLSATIHLLADLLGEVIGQQESPALFEIEERIRALAKARRAADGPAADLPPEQAASHLAAALPEAEREGPEAEGLREVIVLTINGIASGLKNTG